MIKKITITAMISMVIFIPTLLGSINKLSILLHHFATVGKTHQVFGLKIYNSLADYVKAVRSIPKFRSLIKRVLLKICPYTIVLMKPVMV